ncbi:MAG TPA: hypothetical protein VHR66_03735 [Gemmataceae bacterium]|jgi:hypothetical protein|nr:hypothetical protein [Gemmataceae bacterium]
MATKSAGPKPRNDAYTGLLAISFLALVGATVLMAMDAKQLGDPPGKLDIQVPGSTAGKPGEGLKRPDVGKGDPGVPPKDPGMGARAEPKPLPELPAAPVVVPAKAEVPAKTDGDLPPLPVPNFVPPM